MQRITKSIYMKYNLICLFKKSLEARIKIEALHRTCINELKLSQFRNK